MVTSVRVFFHLFLICLMKEALCASIAENEIESKSQSRSHLDAADEGVKAPLGDALSVPGGNGVGAVTARSTGREGGQKMPKNYIISDVMTDGEHEIRLHFSGVSAKQTSVGPSEGSPGGLVVQQLSNGRQLLLMIFNGLADTNVTTGGPSSYYPKQTDAPAQELSLKECSIDTNQARVEEFVQVFRQQAKEARDLVQEVVPLAATSPDLTHVGFARVRSVSHLAAALRPLTNFRALKRKCRRHLKAAKVALKATLRTQRRLHRLEGEAVESDGSPAAIDGSSRARRSITDLFILPGTLWCGNQDRAKSSLELSGHVDADACCRVHDFCPYNIGALTSKYGLFNSNFVTLSHCSCDTSTKDYIVK